MFKKPAFYGVANVGIIIYKTNHNPLIFKALQVTQQCLWDSVIF